MPQISEKERKQLEAEGYPDWDCKEIVLNLKSIDELKEHDGKVQSWADRCLRGKYYRRVDIRQIGKYNAMSHTADMEIKVTYVLEKKSDATLLRLRAQ